MANAITTSLSGYTQQEVEKYFLSPLFLGEDYLSKMTLFPTVKGSMKLDHFAASEKITKTNAGASFSGTEGGAYTQVDLVVGHVEAEMEQKAITFVGTVKSEALKLGTDFNDVDGTVIKEIVSNIMMQGVKRDFKRQLWFGDSGATGTGAADYTPYSGIFKALTGLASAQELVIDVAGGSPTNASTTVAALGSVSAAEAKNILEAVEDAMTPELKELPKTLYVSGSFADGYMKYLRSQGVSESFAYFQDGTPNLRFNGIPIVVCRDWDSHIGNDHALIAGAGGASSTVRVACIADKAVAVGTDFEGSNFETWYSQDDKAYRFRFGYKVGTALYDAKLAVTALSA